MANRILNHLEKKCSFYIIGSSCNHSVSIKLGVYLTRLLCSSGPCLTFSAIKSLILHVTRRIQPLKPIYLMHSLIASVNLLKDLSKPEESSAFNSQSA